MKADKVREHLIKMIIVW